MDVARTLGWTRHETPYEKLDEFAQGMAAMETKAHLDLLVARGDATREADADGVVWYSAAGLTDASGCAGCRRRGTPDR